jgi:branched-chain amino acid transport system permease protein
MLKGVNEMGAISQTVIEQAIVYGLLNGSIYALVSIGFTMTFGTMGIINFSYGALTVVSMYVSLILFTYFNIDPFLSMVITIPSFFILGILIYKFVIQWMLKTPHHIQMMATLGLSIFIENLLLLIFKGKPRGIVTSYTTKMWPLWGDVKLNYPRFVATIIAFVVIISLFLFLKRSFFGKSIEATADNQEGAMFVGIETNRVFMIAFAMACVLEAISGSSVIAFSIVDPYTGFSWCVKAWIVAILSGLGNIPGAIVGGLIVGIIEALVSVFISSSMSTGILFVILLFMLIIKPSGMFGMIRE